MSDVEWQSDPGTTPEQPSLQDSLVEDELETNQPLIVNTVPVLDIQPNRENLEREETVCLCLVPLPPHPLLHMRLCHVHLQVHIKCQQQ